MKDIKCFEGMYAVTSCGKVWSYKQKKFLKPWKNNKGYLCVTLYKKGNNSKKTFLVHRLVAGAYLENKENLKEVNHKDENPLNNCLNNLEWCDRKYNRNYGTANLRISIKQGHRVHCIETGMIFNSEKKAADYYGIRQCALNKHIRGDKNYKHVKYLHFEGVD